MELLATLIEKTKWVRKETLKLHKIAPELRLASSLSPVEIFVVLYYGRIMRYDPQNVQWEERDRLVISKGHGAISLYPILADLDFFNKEELSKIGKKDSLLGIIPDCMVPGFETINGALGHGLGVACGMALALKRKKSDKKVFILCGDGELNEGSVWEGVMFASYHKLNNLIMIVDNNKVSMMGYQKDILGLEPLDEKFEAFGWRTKTVDGHNIEQLFNSLKDLKNNEHSQPSVLIADTRKGKGIPRLENDPLSHVKSLAAEEIDRILEEWK
ncbi:MAG: transketolase [Planctomycetes bacterium RBG_13_44_8b]|nr:MAG: transketolase [Planctomycetes bacterium RBG_13_44_8b]